MKLHQAHERGVLIPVTTNILREAQITKEEAVEYQGVPISDITTIGYVIDYKVLEAKVKITLFDYTGTMVINLFNKIDSHIVSDWINFIIMEIKSLLKFLEQSKFSKMKKIFKELKSLK